MSWLYLVIAGLLEIGFSISLAKMKDTAGDEKRMGRWLQKKFEIITSTV